MTKIIRYLKYVSLVIVFFGIFVPLTLAEEAPDLDGLTGGMSSDGSAILSELLFWFVTIALAVCVIIAAWGVISSNPDNTKNGIKGILFIICVVVLYYVGQFAIIYLKARYGA
jgi:lipopolysaccharide export LptBFGC system permease protein LptF